MRQVRAFCLIALLPFLITFLVLWTPVVLTNNPLRETVNYQWFQWRFELTILVNVGYISLGALHLFRSASPQGGIKTVPARDESPSALLIGAAIAIGLIAFDGLAFMFWNKLV